MQGCISSPGAEKEKAHGLLNAYVSLFLNCHALCIGFSHHHRHVEFRSIEGIATLSFRPRIQESPTRDRKRSMPDI